MDTTVIRVSEPRELLAYIPFRLGFAPRESVVVMSLRTGGRLGLVARVDIADLADAEHGEDLARALAAHVVDDGARRAVVVLYTSVPRAQILAGGTDAGRAAGRLSAVLPCPGREAVWLVGPTGYWGLGCDDDLCCPDGGRPLADLESTQVGAHMVLAGATVATDRDALAVTGRAARPARRSAARAACTERARYRGMREGLESRPGVESVVAWSEAGIRRWDDLRRRSKSGASLPAPELGRLLVALEDTCLRDDIMLSLVPTVDGPGGGDVLSALESVFAPGGTPPAPDVLAPARVVVEAVVAHAPVGRAAPALAVLGWLAWWEGDGARASVILEQCLSEDPDHRLGRILADAVSAGVPPGWVREPVWSSW